MKVLVSAASRHQSTSVIAGFIAELLRKHGYIVELKDPDQVKDLEPYDVVVLGSAVYAGRWLSAARKFIDKHKQELLIMPVWLFSSGPLESTKAPRVKDFVQLETSMKNIKPIGHKVFSGSLDKSQLNLAEKVFCMEAPVSLLADRADWAAKFVKIQQAIQEDRDFGIKRENGVGDDAYRVIDLKYDHIAIQGVEGQVRIIRGYGYRLRDKNFLIDTANPADVNTAYYQPPQSTRANTRGLLLKLLPDITSCDWHQIVHRDPDTGEMVELPLGNVKQSATPSTIAEVRARAISYKI